jgi:hypothetical protein
MSRFGEDVSIEYDIPPGSGSKALDWDLDKVRYKDLDRSELFKTPINVTIYQGEQELNRRNRVWSPIGGVWFTMPLSRITEHRYVEFTRTDYAAGNDYSMSFVPKPAMANYPKTDIGLIRIDFSFEAINANTPEVQETLRDDWRRDFAGAHLPEIASQLEQDWEDQLVNRNVLVRYVISGTTSVPVKFGSSYFFLDKLLLPDDLIPSPPKPVTPPERSN